MDVLNRFGQIWSLEVVKENVMVGVGVGLVGLLLIITATGAPAIEEIRNHKFRNKGAKINTNINHTKTSIYQRQSLTIMTNLWPSLAMPNMVKTLI